MGVYQSDTEVPNVAHVISSHPNEKKRERKKKKKERKKKIHVSERSNVYCAGLQIL